MKKTMLFPALLAIACMSQPPAAPPADAPRVAIDIQYVGVPSMNVYANPSETAPVITTYGYTESVSILARQGNWVEVRTVQGSGWAHAADLIGAREVQPLLATPAPRFLTPPVGIPDPRARGEIIIEAKVNTDGDVVATTIVKNTTRSTRLADANAAALKQAKFYPMVQKGQRLTFTYSYGVTY